MLEVGGNRARNSTLKTKVSKVLKCKKRVRNFPLKIHCTIKPNRCTLKIKAIYSLTDFSPAWSLLKLFIVDSEM